MIKFLKRIPWKDVLVTVLVVALGVGAVVGVGAAITNKQKTVSPFVFERGAIDEHGQHIKSTQSIYTKDYIECQGLEITPDFEASGTYQVFYYDTNKIFLGATSVMDAHSTVTYKKGTDFPYAAYARIVITPETPVDDDGYVDEDYKIRFYEVTSIANAFTIKINKNQKNIDEENLFASSETLHVKRHIVTYDGDKLYKEVDDDHYSYCTVFVTDINSLDFHYENAPMDLTYFFFDSHSYCVGEGSFNFTDTDYEVVVPEDAYMICIIYEESNPPEIYRAS